MDTYNPNGALFSGKQPMKTVDKLSYLNSIEDCYRLTGTRRLAAYFPARPLPSVEIDMDAELPIVMCAGTIVSFIPIKAQEAYANGADASLGISTSGTIPVTVGVDNVVYSKPINLLYDRDIAGCIVPANGGNAQSDSYSDDDGTYGIINVSGAVSSTTAAYSRAANVPMGIVNTRIFSDIRYRYLNYEFAQEPNSIALGGVLTIPYVKVYGSGTRATVYNAINAALKAKHQYVWVTDQHQADVDAMLAVDGLLMPDANGKFTSYDSVDPKQVFGHVLGIRNRIPYGMDEIIDSFPGAGMKGTDTAGLPARYYQFAKTILALTAVKGATYAADKSNIKSTLSSPVLTDTANVYVELGQVDVAFGKINF